MLTGKVLPCQDEKQMTWLLTPLPTKIPQNKEKNSPKTYMPKM